MPVALRSALITVLGLLFAPALASAQSITSEAVSPVPVAGPVGLVILSALLLLAVLWQLRQRQVRPALVVALAVGGGLLWSGAAFLAQSSASFTNPSGETLPIPVTQIEANGNVAGFEWADFTNASAAALVIGDIDEPTFAECFPGGLNGTLLPAASPPPSPPVACSEDLSLAASAICRVNVDAICRAAAAGQLATLTSIAPTSGFAAGNTAVTLTGTNLTGATSVTFDGLAATNVTVVNATTITALTPAHAAGAVDVGIITPQGSATLAGGYTYVSGATLTGVNPTSGTASGGTGVTLTGTGLTGATSVTFDGVPATSVNVVNSTTVTAVTPAHAAGAVDVVVDTPSGGATLTNGYTYITTAVGQPSSGGIIAALNGGLNNLIAAVADNSTAIGWGGFGTAVGAAAQSTTDGASNTAAIVATLGNNGGTPYAAQLCSNYEVDSQGNTPCQAGNTCYNDWFLPAGNNLTATGQLNGLFVNRLAVGGFANPLYWSSTESTISPTTSAWLQGFDVGPELSVAKSVDLPVRCVRAFTP
jgi:hypothetical protein